MSKVAQSVLEAFGETVKRARSLKGWQLKDLSNEMRGTSGISFLSDIEKGKRSISPPTVGKLIAALELEEKWIDKFLNPDGPQPVDEVTEQDKRTDRLFEAVTDDLGIGERYLLSLAREYADEKTSDMEMAYKGLLRALQAARDMADRAALPDNTSDGMQAIRAEVQRLNAAEQVDEADAAITAAFEQKQAEAAALLDLGIQQARIRNDPQAAAARTVQMLHLDTPTDMFEALRALQDAWYVQGRDQGVAFDAQVAIDLARRSVAMASDANERGTALNDLGSALQTLGERDSDTARLQEAVTAYQNALLERTREKVPLQWATTQNNLGIALQTLGERDSDTARLQEAVTAFQNALLEYTRVKVPLQWATTQNNLGIALQTLGARDSDTARLQEAVTAYQNALLERTREDVPLQWATTQNNLGTALKTLGERDSDTARLQEAVTAYQNALLEWTREKVPLNWAMTQGNLANVEIAFFDIDGDAAHLGAALTHAQAAREVFEQAGASHYLEKADQLIAAIQSRQG